MEKIEGASIRNATIRNHESVVEATVQVPVAELRRVVEALGGGDEQVLVTDLSADTATVLVRKRVDLQTPVDRAASDLRLELADRLTEERT